MPMLAPAHNSLPSRWQRAQRAGSTAVQSDCEHVQERDTDQPIHRRWQRTQRAELGNMQSNWDQVEERANSMPMLAADMPNAGQITSSGSRDAPPEPCVAGCLRSASESLRPGLLDAQLGPELARKPSLAGAALV